MTYNEAIKELETILHSLEHDQVDVDDLTARAERAAELIRLCRRKLRSAEASLDQVFDSLDEEDEVEEDEADDEPEMELDEDEDDEPEDEDDAPAPSFRPTTPGRPSAPRLF